jgi:hypothetical protein
MKANNFERAWWSVLDGKHGKWQKIYASNGILEVAVCWINSASATGVPVPVNVETNPKN